MPTVTVGAIRLSALIALIGSLAAPTTTSRAQSLSPYADFQSMSLADLSMLQVKLTYMGNQDAAIGSVLFGGPSATLNAGLFIPFRRADQTYANDDVAQTKFGVTAQELKTLIDSVATLPDVTDGNVDAGGVVSFGLLSTAGTTKAFEAIVNTSTGRSLFAELLSALKNNAEGVVTIRAFGCAAGVLPTTSPSEAGSQVAIKASGLRADHRARGQLVSRVRITNVSGQNLQAPVTLVAVITGDAELVGADGHTCSFAPAGEPFVNVLTSGGLGPGASIERVLRFSNPSGNKLSVTYQVLVGGGTP